mgnify:CR=1 FL=1
MTKNQIWMKNIFFVEKSFSKNMFCEDVGIFLIFEDFKEIPFVFTKGNITENQGNCQNPLFFGKKRPESRFGDEFLNLVKKMFLDIVSIMF